MVNRNRSSILTLTALACSSPGSQQGGWDWMTSAYDAQRSSWVRS